MWDTVPETYSFLPKPEYSSNQLKMRHWEKLRGLWILWHKFHGEDAPKVTWDIWPQVPPTGPWVPPKLWCLTYPNIPPQPITDPLRTLWWVVNASFCGWLVSICWKSAWLQVGKKAESGHHPCPPPRVNMRSSTPGLALENWAGHTILVGLPRWHTGKESTYPCRRHKRLGIIPWVGKIPWRKK